MLNQNSFCLQPYQLEARNKFIDLLSNFNNNAQSPCRWGDRERCDVKQIGAQLMLDYSSRCLFDISFFKENQVEAKDFFQPPDLKAPIGSVAKEYIEERNNDSYAYSRERRLRLGSKLRKHGARVMLGRSSEFLALNETVGRVN